MLAAVLSLPLGTGSLGGQIVSLAAAASVPVTTALLARDLSPDRPDTTWLALLAGLVVALTPHLWQSAAAVMSDTTGLAAVTLGAWALVRYAVTDRRRWLLLSAGAVAFAIDVRTVYALVALPLALAGVMVARRHVPSRWLDVALAAVVGAAVLAPMLVPMLIAAASREPIPFAVSLQSHGWDPANMFRSAFDGPDGHFEFELPMGLFYLLEPARGYHLGLLFAAFALVGVVAVSRRPTALNVAVLIAWPLLIIGFLAGDTTQNTRFALAALPPVAILAATGVGLLARQLVARSQWTVALRPAWCCWGWGPRHWARGASPTPSSSASSNGSPRPTGCPRASRPATG
jgi:4-amino-4-deoxy-L-arabinose transferase-like glycosyltransferase